MKNCCFVIPYFGRFPNYFQLFLNSCKYNPDFNWLIFSDDTSFYDFPPNVRLVKMTFNELKEHVQSFLILRLHYRHLINSVTISRHTVMFFMNIWKILVFGDIVTLMLLWAI